MSLAEKLPRHPLYRAAARTIRKKYPLYIQSSVIPNIGWRDDIYFIYVICINNIPRLVRSCDLSISSFKNGNDWQEVFDDIKGKNEKRKYEGKINSFAQNIYNNKRVVSNRILNNEEGSRDERKKAEERRRVGFQIEFEINIKYKKIYIYIYI